MIESLRDFFFSSNVHKFGILSCEQSCFPTLEYSMLSHDAGT